MEKNILAVIQIFLASGDTANLKIDTEGIVYEETNNKGESFHIAMGEVFQQLGDHILSKESVKERKKSAFFKKNEIGH